MGTFLFVPPSERERIFVERGRAAFSEKFPEQQFDDGSWDIRHLKDGGAGQGNVNLLFVRIAPGKRLEQLPSSYADIIKSSMAVSEIKAGSKINRLSAARWLWEAISERLAGQVEAFSWAGFKKIDAERAEELMLSVGCMEESSVYRRCRDLDALLKDLSAAGVIAPMKPTFKTPRADDLSRHTLAGQEERMEKLPSEAAIEALGDLFSGKHILSVHDSLISCVTTILFATGLRISEVLHLQTDALRREDGRWFIYYLKAKSAAVVEEKQALSKLQGELVEAAVSRAMDLTKSMRDRARELAQSPHIFPLPQDVRDLEYLSAEQISLLSGMKVKSVARLPASVARISAAGGMLFSRRDFQDYMQMRRVRSHFESVKGVKNLADGKCMPLNQALFLTTANQGHATKAENPLLVGLLSQGQVGAFLGGHYAQDGTEKICLTQSIFERLALKEKDDSVISLHAHQLRHYVTTKATSAGIPDAYILRWQRREYIGDLEAYQHLTPDERVSRLKDALKDGRLQGELATMYLLIAEDERERFLDGVLQAVHVTPFGLCIHDFNTAPCPKALNCVKGCGSYLVDPSDAELRTRLEKTRDRVVLSLDGMTRSLKEGKGVMAKEWERDCRETKDGLDRILAVSASKSPGLVAPFSENPSKFERLN